MADPTEHLAKAREVAGFHGACEFSTAEVSVCPASVGPPCEGCQLVARITEAIAGVERERDRLRAALEELLNEVDDVWLEETPGMRSGRTALQGEYSVTFNMGSHTVGQAYHKSHFAEADSACPVCRGDEPPALQGE